MGEAVATPVDVDPIAAGEGFRLDSHPERLREWLSAMWRYRAVMLALARKEFKIRYKRTALGVVWSAALPVLQAAVMIFIFSRVANFGSGGAFSYAGYVLAGMVAFVYSSTSILASTTAIVDGSGLTDKVWFPRAILSLVSPIANLVTLGISLVVLLVALPIVDADIGPQLLLLVPAVVLTVAFVSALGLLLSALQVYFRDVKFLVQATMTVWIYLTPIIYPPDTLGSAARWLDFNPLTGIVGLYQRAAVDAPVPSGRAIIVSIVATVVIAVGAIAVHRRHDRLFVDLL
jgi:ABC-type polysaccharide/polyol phosphate export permease